MTTPTTFSPALRAEPGKLDVAHILSLLGDPVTALARIPVRRLDQVLVEIAAAQRAFNWAYHHNLPNEADRLDHLQALQDEARAMIEAATGVSWEAISAATL